MADLSTSELSDADVEQLIAAGVVPEQIDQLQKQLQQVQMLRATPMPAMRGDGRVQTAANPLEFLGAGLQQYAGMKQGQAAQQKIDALRKQQVLARQLYGRKVLDTPYRRESQPFIQPMQVDPRNVPIPGMQM